MKNSSIRNKFTSLFYRAIGLPSDFSIEHRFIVLCSFIGFAVSFITLIMNLVIGMGVILVIASIISMTAFSLFIWIARIRKKVTTAKWLMAGFIFILLSSFWYVNNGSYGPVLYLFLVFFIFLLFIWEGPNRLLFIILYAINLILFFYLEYYHSYLFDAYPSEATRLWDNYTGYVLYVFVGGFIILSAKNNYIREKKKAEQSDRLKSAFLANISHEIRTPMNAILGFTQLLEDEELTPTEKKAFTRIIQDNSESLLKLIENIIDVSKIESGQFVLDKESFSVNTVFIDLEKKYNRILKEQQKDSIELKFIEPQYDLSLKSDEFRFRQIMDNLISNAVKYTNKGFIYFGYQFHGPEIHFFVKDSGIGIKKEDHDKVFERFRKIEREGQEHLFGGTGIGLAITKSLIELMQGMIWIESEYLKGSTFWFSLPQNQEMDEKANS